ncbi:unnamed protein product [Orchesella dallaii]|uniref:Uncharacterized protein n=1 Tax=Orchesella dallaii TaxID=48710 RepID=A0ABP1RJZ1_9HEXA
MESPTDIIETSFPQLSWLSGFENCSNYVVFNDNVNILPQNSIQLVTLSLLPVVLFLRTLGNCSKIKFSLRSTCTTISFIDGFHLGNKIDEPFFINAQLSNNFMNMGGTKHILFLVIPHVNSPGFTPYPGFLLYLSSSNYYDIPFRVHYEFSHAPISKFNFAVLVRKIPEVIFICRFCKIFDPYGKSYPFVDHPVKCNWLQGCRKEMHEMYMNVTGDGKNIYYFCDEIMDTELNLTLDFKRIQTFLKKNPTTIQLVMMTMIKYIPGIRGSYNDSLYYSSPWIRSDLTVETAVSLTDLECIPMGRIYYDFLTCHGKNSVLDFYAYIKVFDWRIWALLLICMGLTLFGALRISDSWLETANRMLGLLVNTASLDHSGFRNNKIRLLLTIWLLTAFVFSNFYNSANTATFLVPRKINRIQSILETEDFSIFAFVKNSITKNQYYENLTILAWDTEFGEDVYEWIRSRYPRHANIFYGDFLNKNLTQANNVFNSQMMQKLLNIYYRIRPIFSTQSTDTRVNLSQVVDLIENCYKTIFVSTYSNINKIGSQIRYSQASVSIYKGKNEFIPRHFVVAYDKQAGSYLKRQLSFFMSSGQNIFWQKRFERISTNFEPNVLDKDEQGKPLSLKSNFVSIVYILFGGEALAIGFLMFEVLHGLMKPSASFCLTKKK